MADRAADLVDRVLPEASVRQWILSLPFSLRYRPACDARLNLWCGRPEALASPDGIRHHRHPGSDLGFIRFSSIIFSSSMPDTITCGSISSLAAVVLSA